MKTNTEHRKGTEAFVPGLCTAGALILYFLLMRWAGLAGYTGFRMLNFVIMFTGVYITMRRAAHSENHEFFHRLGSGCLTAVVACALFSFFLFFWLTYDHPLMEELKQVKMIGSMITPGYAAAIIFGEGLSSGVIMSYIFLSYTDHATKSENKPGYGRE